MDIAKTIEDKVRGRFQARRLQLVNESSMHAGPATDSHYKLTLVSDDFIGLSRVKRHQALYALLRDELQGPLHALALHLHTIEEWEKLKGSPPSPKCAR